MQRVTNNTTPEVSPRLTRRLALNGSRRLPCGHRKGANGLAQALHAGMSADMTRRIFELGRAAMMREEQEARGATAPAPAAATAAASWDGVLTRKLVDVTLAYIAPFIKERAMLAAEPARVVARFVTVVMRVLLPVRRAWRRLRPDVTCATEGDEGDEEVAMFWRCLSENAGMLHIRRAVGFMGVVGCANALWRLLMHGATQDGRLPHGDGRETTTTSAGVNTSAGVSKSSSVHLTPALDAAMFRSTMGWHECVAVTVNMMPDCRNTPTQKLWGTRLALPSEVR